RVLTDHGVDDEKDFVRVNCVANIARLGHESFINAQSTCGVNDDDVMLRALGFFNTCLRNLNGIPRRSAHLMVVCIDGGTSIGSKSRNACALTHDFKLLNRAWALQVTGHQHWSMPLARQVLG